jgi:hypothetical protein
MDRNERSPWRPHLHASHAHLPHRGMSRRQLLGTAGTAGALLVVGFPKAALGVDPGSGIPNPIPHVNPPPGPPVHFFFPGPVDGSVFPTDPHPFPFPGRDPSTIFDFKGFIGQADLNLSGLGTDTTTGDTDTYTFHTDMRFMKGKFVDTAGVKHSGAFAFI